LRKTLCEFLVAYYAKGWFSGTGGGLCAAFDTNRVLMAPTGVHKERVVPSDLFVMDPRNGTVVRAPKNQALCPSECGGIFSRIIQQRGAGSVLHTHALSSVLAADLAGDDDRILFHNLEMLKGLAGGANTDRHVVAVVRNTPREAELVGQIEKQLDAPDFEKSYCILVRDHGAYIWGRDVWEAKRHAEVYHFLFEATVARCQKIRG
jgi:methylthioribulose-1-phosphate dehydratase